MSPIKNLTEIRRMPRIGKIRLGVKVETINKLGKKVLYPKATDYFVCKADESTPVCSAEAFARVYPGQPKALDVVIPCEDLDKFFQQWYRRYGSGTGLICKGDGETATEVDRETGEMHDHECLGRECEWLKGKHCKPVGNFMFMLPKVDGLGCWQLDTGSWHSIVQINSSVDFLRGLAGRISGILLQLVIAPKQVQYEGKKKTVYVIDLKPPAGVSLDALLATPIPGMQRLAPPNWTPQQRQAALEAVGLADPNERPSIAPPRVVNGDTGEILDTEEPTEMPPDADEARAADVPEAVVTEPAQEPAPTARKRPPADTKAATEPAPKPLDPATAFWTWAKAHDIPDAAARPYAKSANGDMVLALANLQKVYAGKVEAA